VVKYTQKDSATRPNPNRPSKPSIVRLRLADLATIRQTVWDGGVLPDNSVGLRNLEVTVNYLVQAYSDEVAWKLALNIAPWARQHIVEFMLRKPRAWRADALGRYLEIPEWARVEMNLVSIGSKDMSSTERKDLRRKKDKAYQAERRKAEGSTPRSQSKAATEPWKVFGWSRAKWYRLGQPKPPIADESVSLPIADEFVSSVADESVSPPTIASPPIADATVSPINSADESPRGESRARARIPESLPFLNSADEPVSRKAKSRLPHTHSKTSASQRSARKWAIQGVAELPAEPISNGRHPGGRSPSRHLLTLTAFTHKKTNPYSVKFSISQSADFLRACGLGNAKGFAIEPLAKPRWVRVTKGTQFKPRGAHQTKQIHLYRGQMRHYHDYGDVLPFDAVDCFAIVGRGYYDLRLPTTVQAKRAERKKVA
jgi:hypothetical protein